MFWIIFLFNVFFDLFQYRNKFSRSCFQWKYKSKSDISSPYAQFYYLKIEVYILPSSFHGIHYQHLWGSISRVWIECFTYFNNIYSKLVLFTLSSFSVSHFLPYNFTVQLILKVKHALDKQNVNAAKRWFQLSKSTLL